MIATLAEIARLIRGRRVLAGLSFLTGAICAATIVTTVGSAEATRSEVLAALNAPGQRLVVVTDGGESAGISPHATRNILRASSAEWVVSAGPLFDSTLSTVTSAQIPTRRVDQLPEPTEIVTGRAPSIGEATIPIELAETIGLFGPWGSLNLATGESIPIVGLTETDSSLGPVQGVAFVKMANGTYDISRVIVQVDRPGLIPSAVKYVQDALVPQDDSQIAVTTTDLDALVRLEVADDLARNRARIGAASLAAAVLLNAVNGLALVSSQRKRFGLTRALGATRSRVVVLILGFSGLTAGLGGLAGTAASAVGQQWLNDLSPTPDFLLASGLAVLLSSMAGTVLPALVAGRQDPVRVLRSP